MARSQSIDILIINTCHAGVERDGCVVLPSGVSGRDLDDLLSGIAQCGVTVDFGIRGVRDAFRLLSAVQQIAVTGPTWALASPVLGADCGAVRAIIFEASYRT